MTLDEMFKQYVHNAVKEYLEYNLSDLIRGRNIIDDISTEDLESIIDKYLNEHDYVTRDDVNDQISGATVYIEASLSA